MSRCCAAESVPLISFLRLHLQALESDALALAVPQATRALSIAMLQQMSAQTPAPAAATVAPRQEAGMDFLLEVAGKRGRKGLQSAAAH